MAYAGVERYKTHLPVLAAQHQKINFFDKLAGYKNKTIREKQRPFKNTVVYNKGMWKMRKRLFLAEIESGS
jgi:hypothetical protein